MEENLIGFLSITTHIGFPHPCNWIVLYCRKYSIEYMKFKECVTDNWCLFAVWLGPKGMSNFLLISLLFFHINQGKAPLSTSCHLHVTMWIYFAFYQKIDLWNTDMTAKSSSNSFQKHWHISMKSSHTYPEQMVEW